jgi:type IV pilus assembly protein PilC
MATFAYVARDEAGTLVEGEVRANTTAEAAKVVRSEKKFVVKITPKGSGAATRKPASSATVAGPKRAKPGSNKYKPADLIYFTNQLAVMVETGVGLADALDACTHEDNSPRFAAALASVIESVRGGSEFSAALAQHPRVFAPVYVSLIKSSEVSGMMSEMLKRLAIHLEAQREMTKKIKGAVTYPIVMFVFAIGVTIFLMTFVLPKFTNIYAGREDKIPALTRYLLKFSDNLTAYGLYVLAGLVAAGVGLFMYFRGLEGRMKLERFRLAVPLVGPMFHKNYLARSLRTLGTMIQSGVSMLDAVRLTSTACGSLVYEQMWNTVRERLESGQQLSEALTEYKSIPRAVNKMLGAGERTGQLGPVMERVAIFCESELNVAIKTLTSMLEPAIVMFLGVVVGGLVLALLLPIFTISKAMH